MQDQHQQAVRRLPLGLVASVSAVLVTVGGGAAWWAWNEFQSPTTTPAPTTPQQPSKPVQPSAEKKVQVYWLNNVDNRIEVVPSSIVLKASDEPS